MSKEPQGELISMQLPQMSIVSIHGISRLVLLLELPSFGNCGTDDRTCDSKHVAYCEYFHETTFASGSNWIKDK